ncbi:MAG: hypothetical protein K5872_20920 [Rhizobiaceae bacterium]|nr:hypothetical protein [Rhizobiaceae bacterium]MCV0408680.1 hypothetical protein [Rhizobiaceae bacterium]
MTSLRCNWNKNDATRLVRCLATELYRRGHRGRDLVARVRLHLPMLDSFFGHPVSDGAIESCGYNGCLDRNDPVGDPKCWDVLVVARMLIDKKIYMLA